MHYFDNSKKGIKCLQSAKLHTREGGYIIPNEGGQIFPSEGG